MCGLVEVFMVCQPREQLYITGLSRARSALYGI